MIETSKTHTRQYKVPQIISLGKRGGETKNHGFSLRQQPDTNRIGQAGQRDLREKGKEKKKIP
jgi:hypothetical protein